MITLDTRLSIQRQLAFGFLEDIIFPIKLTKLKNDLCTLVLHIFMFCKSASKLIFIFHSRITIDGILG